jgi:pyridinium-3,5-bisthiocarboxylic acid mononucleotide nickel chelatase
VKVLYFDCFAGAAGDMIIGALLDAGVPFEALTHALGSLAVEGWDVSVDRVVKTGVTAAKFRVHEHAHQGSGTGDQGSGRSHHPHHRHHPHHPPHSPHPPHPPHPHHPHHTLDQIVAAVNRSSLSAAGKARAIGMFNRLAEAEAAIHGTAIDKVHLHEVGALDSIIDIVGAVFAIDWLQPERIVVSPINVGGGMVRTEHGVFPVPAPATLSLIRNAPVYSSGIQSELLTPTGALILTEFASSYGPIPPMTVDRVGYGAGDRELKETPNVVRVLVGDADTSATQASAARTGQAGMRVTVVECEIDDMNPQIFGVLMERLYAAGALEVFYSPVQMKKNRPGTLMTIVAAPAQRDAMIEIVFRESTTIGVRHQELSRECLDREMVSVATPLGAVRFKVARRDGRVLNAQPEFDDLAKLSAEHGIPVKDVQALAHKAWLER